MRPLRLHLENFGSFREATAVDFSDSDYFVLVGATGAGKSTVIDAICFALYGKVPRWGDGRVIGHALAPSAIAGKVALVFEAGGRRHAVIRAVQRDAKGVVHTKEAMLYELDPDVPADASVEDMLEAVVGTIAGGDELTAAVQRITGLDYKFFTQCVVLPQGRFAEFLHAPPRQRQDLLVQLLDAEVYEEIRKRALLEEKAAAQAAEMAQSRLAGLAYADEAAEKAASERVATLHKLATDIGTELDALRERELHVSKLREELSTVREGLAALTGLAMPPDVASLGAQLQAAVERLGAFEQDAADAEAAEQATEETLAKLGDESELRRDLSTYEARDGLMAKLKDAEEEISKVAATLGALAAKQAEAEASAAEAEHELELLRTAHEGAVLAQRLTVGEPCPTCLQTVHTLPDHELPGDLATAQSVLQERRGKAAQATADHRAAANTLEIRTSDALKLREELARQGMPAMDRAEIVRRLDLLEEASASLRQARNASRDARKRLAAARKQAEGLRGSADRHWRELGTARDTVVTLGAPPLDRDDLQGAWRALLAWRDEAAEAQRATLAAREAAVTEAEKRRDADRAQIADRLASGGVTVPPDAGPESVRTALLTVISSAERELDQIKRDRKLAAGLAAEVKAKRHEARVAHELATVLRANGFERWLCEEALDLLVRDASETLRELSDGQYELALGKAGEIEVVDHAEAGMRRNARTLSGGETFQAALALALALSGQVSGLSAAAARSLDSIFLDEGFGTLDPVTLDTVATTLERLAAGSDRMVGIVTHVPALADRVPVRFEVTRDAKGSHLRKVGP